jgi:16S rRNA C1402 (ribose-2'-O) methylase RsmI
MENPSGSPCALSSISTHPLLVADFAPREDLNSLVKRHIQTVVTSTPHRALNMLETDAAELIASGMVTLNAKLMGIHESKLIARVVETWNFFWDQVLTYVEGVINLSSSFGTAH